jgi:hypothetical protein
MFGVGVGVRVGGRTASGGGFDADAQAFFDRVTAAGGTLTTTEKNATNQLVLDMKSASIWTAMKAIYPMVGASAAACAQNLKSSSFTGTFTSGWTFSSTGVTPSNAYMDTGLNQSTELTQTSGEIGAYFRTNVAATQVDMGAYQGTSGYALITKLSDNFFYGRVASIDTDSTYQPPTTLGLFSVKANGTNSMKFVRNGVIVSTKGTTTSALVSINVAIGAGRTLAGSIFPSTKQTAFNYISDSLTDTQNANLYTAVQAFQTTLSRQV